MAVQDKKCINAKYNTESRFCPPQERECKDIKLFVIKETCAEDFIQNGFVPAYRKVIEAEIKKLEQERLKKQVDIICQDMKNTLDTYEYERFLKAVKKLPPERVIDLYEDYKNLRGIVDEIFVK